jgi:hypothetical protein
MRSCVGSQSVSWAWGLGLCFVLSLLVGCGSASGKGKVSGKVTFAGQPVTGGSITFAPLAAPNASAGAEGGARPATGRVAEDGTFSLSTDEDGDGALIGRHSVVYSPPSAATETPDPRTPPSPYFGLVPKEREFEVKEGSNEVTVELVKPQ